MLLPSWATSGGTMTGWQQEIWTDKYRLNTTNITLLKGSIPGGMRNEIILSRKREPTSIAWQSSGLFDTDLWTRKSHGLVKLRCHLNNWGFVQQKESDSNYYTILSIANTRTGMKGHRACGFVQPWEIAKRQKVPEDHQIITRESVQFPL